MATRPVGIYTYKHGTYDPADRRPTLQHRRRSIDEAFVLGSEHPRGRGSSGAPALAAGIVFLAACSIVGLSSYVEHQGAFSPLLPLCLVLAVLAALIPAVGVYRLAYRDWFHPLLFPTTYLVLVLFAPSIYVLATDRPLGLLFAPADISTDFLLVAFLSALGIGIGVSMGLLLTRSHREPPARLDTDYTVFWGRVLLYGSVVLEGARWWLERGHAYGWNQISLGPATTATTLAAGLLLIGVILVSIGNTHRGHDVLRFPDAIAILAFAVPSLAIGSRGDLLPPALFLLWAHHTYVRRLPLRHLAALSLFLLIVFNAVGQYRSDSVSSESSSPLAETLKALSSPSFLTAQVVARVPSAHPYYEGSTYLAALERQLPGFLSTRLFGLPTESTSTGSYAYRHLIGFSNPNMGFAFSLPTEAYMNFGLLGAFFVPLSVGTLIGWSYRRVSTVPYRALHLLYPLLIAVLPTELRDDALGQLKIILYPMAITALVLYRARRRARSPIRPAISATPPRPGN